MLIRGEKQDYLTFICDINPAAKSVYLVGDFNQWQLEKKPMFRAKDGTFRTRMDLRSGRYQYKFVVDGLWFNDPDSLSQVINSFGTLNSVFEVD